MPIHFTSKTLFAHVAVGLLLGAAAAPAVAQDRRPWQSEDDRPVRPYDDRQRTGDEQFRSTPTTEPPYRAPPAPRSYAGRGEDAYRAPQREPVPYRGEPPPYQPSYRDQAGPAYREPGPAYGTPYDPAPAYGPSSRDAYNAPPPRQYEPGRASESTFSMREITEAGHGFFGSISQGLASVIEHAFKKQGRPNGYILGEDLGGAFVAGLRYGEGKLHTKDAGSHRVYWQGPSIGFDAGGEGSKVMVLVYNLRDPREIYQRFGGVAGSAYVVGGVGLTFQTNEHVVLAPIRAGIGLRLGANIGYLKYSRHPTWNPF